jgi:hypothetical protein
MQLNQRRKAGPSASLGMTVRAGGPIGTGLTDKGWIPEKQGQPKKNRC